MGHPMKTRLSKTSVIVLIAILTFLGLAGLLLAFVLPVPFVELEYGLMVDAGSTKSEIRIYQWPHQPDDAESSLPQLEEAPGAYQNPYSHRVEPGISAYVGKEEELQEAMEELLAFAMEKIPADQHAITPLFLKATAGMRLLTEEEQLEILTVIRRVFRDSVFRFDDDSWATVISGQDEGVFGWLTVNHLTGKLANEVPEDTYGALDLGGASTQITFVPESKAPQDNYTLVLDKMTYELFSKSYLYYGSDQARFGFNESLIEVPGDQTLQDPCLNLGYNQADATFQSGEFTYTLNGTSSYQDCEALIIQNLFAEDKFPPPISELRGLFYAFSGFVYTPAFFKLPADASIEMLRQEGIIYCGLTWDEVLLKYPNDQPRFLANYCFNAAYIVSILEYAYGFDAEKRGEITFMAEVTGVNLDWTMGAMLFEAANVEAVPTPTKPLFQTAAGIGTIIASVALLVLAFGTYLFYRRYSNTNPEEFQRLTVNPEA